MKDTSKFFAGELVEVRNKEDILATLDENGRLDDLPFMPEMLAYCGRQFRVYKRAHKTCDFVNKTGIRSLPETVHLEGLRCDGAAHGGCQAQCMLFWKDAWLKRVEGAGGPGKGVPGIPAQPVGSRSVCTEETVSAATRASGSTGDGSEPVYRCQATLLPKFTHPLRWWDFRQYLEDCRSGNVSSKWKIIPRLAFRAYDNLINLGIGIGPGLRWLYDRVSGLRGGGKYPGHSGKIPLGEKTPAGPLNLQPGELVRVKSHQAILETVDVYCKNRGMSFSMEMVPYCGKVFRVRSRVTHIIDEVTGKMLTMKNPCIILEGVICQALYNKKMIFCPRATFPYWREIWLERVEGDAAPVAGRSEVSISAR